MWQVLLWQNAQNSSFYPPKSLRELFNFLFEGFDALHNGLLGWTLGKSVSKAGGRGSLVSFIRYCRFTCDRDSCSTLTMGERSLDSLGGGFSVFELYRSLFSSTFLRQLSLVCCIKRHAGEQDMLSCKSEN